MLLLDLTHTSHTTVCTGIQRQARGVFGALTRRTPVTGVCFDRFAQAWRALDAEELRVARGEFAPTESRRGAQWSWGRRLRSWGSRLGGGVPPLPFANALICAEIFSPAVAQRLPELFARVAGPRVAFFFDTIPLTHPEFTPRRTVARFPSYLQELLQFDGIAANSRTTADSLRGYWEWLGVKRTPDVTVLPLGADLPKATPPRPASRPPQVLSLGSIEGRKNHVVLLAAAEQLWAEGVEFELRLVGMPRPETAGIALAEIERLQRAGRPLRFEKVLTDAALEEAWSECSFSVYPSLIEGFGLPVLESLAHGKPCVCADTGATGELVAAGGCIGVDPTRVDAFVAAIRRLLSDTPTRERLSAEAKQRRIPTWDDSAAHLEGWLDTLRARP